MRQKSDMSPRKVGKIEVLLSETQLKQRNFAQKKEDSAQFVSVIKIEIDSGTGLGSKRVERCGRKRKTT